MLIFEPTPLTLEFVLIFLNQQVLIELLDIVELNIIMF